jgi:2-polyprenyl-3-methyl-5-hydroxy-6-metoxy-1,4-benzoquinol methylase
MLLRGRSIRYIRSQFDEIYDSSIVGAGFAESHEYYKRDKERYWRSLELLCQLNIPNPARLLEIGGGQIAILFKKLFNDDCVVADLSEQYISPLRKEDLRFFQYNLLKPQTGNYEDVFDVVVLLEVIEHIPVPAHVVFERVKRFMRPNGILFVTTPNLFRLRNLIRMFFGVEFLDHFDVPDCDRGLGHQLEYSADHLRWQLERAGLQIVMLRQDELGRIGHSFKARLGRALATPLQVMRPLWRDGLVAAARKPSPG